MKKRLLSLALALMMFVSLLSAIGSQTVYADDTKYTATFNLNGGDLTDAQIVELIKRGWGVSDDIWHKDFIESTDYSAIIAEWDGIIPSSSKQGYKFYKWTPNSGTLTEDTTFTANYMLPNYLTFTAQEDNSSVTFSYNSGTDVYYSTDGGNKWNPCQKTCEITLAKTGDTVKFSGMYVKTTPEKHFAMTGKIAASGDVTSLTNGSGGDVDLSKVQNYGDQLYGHV